MPRASLYVYKGMKDVLGNEHGEARPNAKLIINRGSVAVIDSFNVILLKQGQSRYANKCQNHDAV